jgi:two-component sensor histidine kinase
MRHFFTALFLSWLLLLTGLGTSVKAQSIHRPEADSLLRVLAQSKADTNQVKVLLRLGEYQVYKPGEFKADVDSAYAYAKAAEDLSRTLRFENGYEGSQRLLVRILLERKRVDEVKDWLQKSKVNRTKADLLLELGQYYLYKPGKIAADLDSAEVCVRQALDLNTRLKDGQRMIKSLIKLVEVFSEKANEVQAAAYYRQVIPFIEQVKDPLQRAEFWDQLGGSYIRSGTGIPDKLKAHEQALALYRRLGKKEQEAGTLKTIADMHQVQGKLAQSLRELMEVLRIQKSIGFRNLHYTFDLLGHVHMVMGNHEQALPYALAAIESAKATADTSALTLFYSRVGIIYQDLGQHEQALEIFQKVFFRRKAYTPDKLWISLEYLLLIRSMLELNRPRQALALIQQTIRQYPPKTPVEEVSVAHALGYIYLALKQYPTAERYLLKALSELEENHTTNWHYFYRIDISQKIVQIYMDSGRYQKARYYLSQAFARSEQNSHLQQKSHLHLQAFRLDSLQGNLSSAISHYQQYTALKDSIFNERKFNQLIAHQVQYDTEKKEQDLKLKEKNIALLREQSKAQQTQRNALVGGTVLLLSLLGLIYNRYRLKQHSNRELQAQQQELQAQKDALQAQQEEINHKNEHLSQLLGEKDSLLEEQQRLLEEKERLLKEIHHRVKNNLQVVMSLLNSQADALQDKAALSAIQESQHRVQAMALIHQKLYQAEGVACILMQDYVEEVVAYLHESYCLDHIVRFCLEVEPIELDVTQAVPLGLIINEVITNAFKYAFPDGRPGTVTLRLLRLTEATYQLTIADDGVGLPPNYDPSQSRSLGMTLLHGFSGQLGGELTITSPPGLTINLVFEEEQLSPVFASSVQAR